METVSNSDIENLNLTMATEKKQPRTSKNKNNNSDKIDTEAEEANEGINILAKALMNRMQISGEDKGSIGVKKIRKKRLSELLGSNKRTVLRVFKTIAIKIACLFLPKDFNILIGKGYRLFEFPFNKIDVLIKSL